MNQKNIKLTLTLIVIIVCTIGLYFWIIRGKPQDDNVLSTNQDKSTTPPTQISLEVSEIENPVDYFYKYFSTKNYKVRTIVNDTAGYTFYYKKGQIVRVDGEGQYNSEQSHIIKNEKLYTVDNTNKTFVELSLDDMRSTYLLSILKVASILDPIIQGETPTATPWSSITYKSENENILEYQTLGRNFVSYIPNTSILVDIKLTIDPNARLITSISIKSEKEPNWITTKFAYEEITNIDSFTNFPLDYKKIDPK